MIYKKSSPNGELFLLFLGSFPNLEAVGVVHLRVVVNHFKVDETPLVEVDIGEESVGLKLLVEAGQIKTVGLGQELLVDAAPPMMKTSSSFDAISMACGMEVASS